MKFPTRVSWKLAAGLILVAAAALAAWLGAARPWEPRHPRVILLGLDGLDNLLLDRLIAEGKLPHFKKMREEGAWGDLRTIQPILSPVVWSSIITGRSPEDHDVFDFLEEDGRGGTRTTSSLGRKAPALWSIASHYGVRSGFIGWYGSWPAEEVNGFVVTNKPGSPDGNHLEGIAFPTALEEITKQPEAMALTDSRLTRFFRAPLDTVSDKKKESVLVFSSRLAITEMYRALMLQLTPQYRPRLLGFYSVFPDAPSHLFADYSPPPLPGLPPEDVAAFAAVVDECYVYLDEIVGEAMALMGDDTVLIICSDHGFHGDERKPLVSANAQERPLAWHRIEGVVMFYGHGVRRGHRLKENASIYDIAPTALHLAGVPLSRELEGAVLWEAFSGDVPRTPAWVDSYADVPRRPVLSDITDADDNAALRAELRALGYLGGGDSEDRESALRRARHARTLNQGRYYLGVKQWDKAFTAFDEARRMDPNSAEAHLGAGKCERRMDRLEAARESLERAAALGAGADAWAELAEILRDRGDAKGALAALERGRDAEPRSQRARELLAYQYARMGRHDDALAELRASLPHAEGPKGAAHIHNTIGTVEASRGRFNEALAAFRESIRIYPHDFQPHANIGVLFGKAEAWDKALEAFKEAERLAPPNHIGLLNELGKAAALLGRRKEALDYFHRSLAVNPNQPVIREVVKEISAP